MWSKTLANRAKGPMWSWGGALVAANGVVGKAVGVGGQHESWLAGVGERLWQRSPGVFAPYKRTHTIHDCRLKVVLLFRVDRHRARVCMAKKPSPHLEFSGFSATHFKYCAINLEFSGFFCNPLQVLRDKPEVFRFFLQPTSSIPR